MIKGKYLRKPSHLLSVVHTGPWSTCDIFCEPPICIADICIPVRKRKILLLILDALINLVEEKWLLRELMKSWRLSGGEFLLTCFYVLASDWVVYRVVYHIIISHTFIDKNNYILLRDAKIPSQCKCWYQKTMKNYFISDKVDWFLLS